MEKKRNLHEIISTSLKLGLTSFGGPVAHLGYFKTEYVDKRNWLSDETYAQLVALCQFLPGPASSQVGIAIGMVRGGFLGGLLSWIGFTIPSVAILVFFAYAYQSFTWEETMWIASLKVVAVAVVAHAVLGLGKKLTPDIPRISLAFGATILMLLFPSTIMQLSIIVTSAFIGLIFFTQQATTKERSFFTTITKRQGIIALTILVGLFVSLPILSAITQNPLVHLFDIFYRVGSLVFGGGHVVLPLLEQEIVPLGLISASEFLAGYGMAQAVPGPLFTFASYIGAMIYGLGGALLATVAIFLPSFLFIVGALPFLRDLQKNVKFQGMLTGVNASVVGILLAALYDPVITSSIHNFGDIILAAGLFALLYFARTPAWAVVLIGICFGIVRSFI